MARPDTTSSTGNSHPAPMSRAVLRDVEPGTLAECTRCGERIGYRARERRRQVISNVYDGGAWQRVEHHHPDCYLAAGSPHGDVDTGRTSRVQERMALREATTVH